MEYPEFHLHPALVHFPVALSAFAEDHGLCPWMNAKKLLLRRDVRRRAKPLVIRRRITPGALIHEVNQQGVKHGTTGFARGAPFVSALLMETASFLFKKESFHRSAIHLYVLACILAPFAVWTGLEEAKHEHLKHPVVDLHRNFALATLGVSWAGAVSLGLVHKRFPKYFRLVFVIFLFLTAALATLAAYNGGRLVYEHAIGVES
ncbi:MAG: hypothetical protein A2705_04060 [Omnitrophica WOR_2 bacterium RIFCSPHIGHO2_01_FULL_52_10]|nr:MAG: hypothetical protein A2705_04060 [Omnitrophica WOR_2 bacterium RIFCSPHIGHO2_01_FULL_52_10]